MELELNPEAVVTPGPTGGVTPPAEAVQTPVEAATPEPTPEELALEELENALPEEKSAKRAGFQKRIGEITTKRREAEQRAHELELQLAEERGQRTALERVGRHQETPPAEIPVAALPQLILPNRPDASQWTDADGYEDQDKKFELLADWRAEVKFLERDQAVQQERVQTEHRANMQKGQEFVRKVTAEHPDFNSLMLSGPQPTETVAGAIMSLNEHAPELAVKLAYHLSKNPAEMQRVNALSPMAAAVAIGTMAASLPATPPPKTITQTPPPIAPVTPAAPIGSKPINSAADYIEAMDREQFGQ